MQHERDAAIPGSIVFDAALTVGLTALALSILATAISLVGAIFISAKVNTLRSSVD